ALPFRICGRIVASAAEERMGLLDKLLGGAQGCREFMRDAYEHHAKAAREKHMDAPHLIGLYGALRSRYRGPWIGQGRSRYVGRTCSLSGDGAGNVHCGAVRICR